MRTWLINKAGYLSSLLLKLSKRMRAVLGKSTCADVGDLMSEREAYFAPFCQVSTASGTQWACEGHGCFYVLKAKDVEEKASVAELLYHAHITFPIALEGCIEESDIWLTRMQSLFEAGLGVPLKYLSQAKQSQERSCQPYRSVFKKCHHDADCHDGQQRRNGPGCHDCPIQHFLRRS